MMNLNETLQQAVASHQAGQFPEAEELYLSILQVEPNHPDANHNLGMLLGMADGLCYLKAALEADPARGQFWLSYADALLASGQANEALLVMQTAMECGLDSPVAQLLRQQAEAAVLVERLADVAEMPDREARSQEKSDVIFTLGLPKAGKSTVKKGKPAKNGKGVIKPVRHQKTISQAECNQLVALFNAGRYAELESRAHILVRQYPDSGFVWKVLGVSLRMQGKDALSALQKAAEFLPNDAEAHNNLGNILRDHGQLDDAVASYRRALEIAPNDAEAHSNLGNALKDLGRLDDAVASYRRALETKPDLAEAHSNLGNALQEIGQLDDALASCRRAMEIKPDFLAAHSNLLFTLNYHPDLSAEEIYRAYQECDALLGIPLRSTWRPHTNDKTPNRRLRIGYVSPDFRRHSCLSFLEPVLSRHDKTQVEVYAYAEISKEDEMTSRYKSYVEHWISTKGMSDEALAERIRNDGIDILVELAGHTVGNRLLTFARKPAPVSLSWLGYGYTTGFSAIDYYLTDAACVPVGCEELFAEHPWRIANPAYVYRPNCNMGAVSRLPALQRGYITFGTLTRMVRVNHRTIRVWSEILKQVEGARLVIDSSSFKDPAMQEQLAAKFVAHGIRRERLEIGYHSPPWDVLRGIDIGLDCFPHNSGTTLFESLYMGVPFITLAGRPSVGRLGNSILQGIGHPEWIAGSEADYVAKAVGLASDLDRLAAQRASLRTEMENSQLLDEVGFAHKVEDAYRGMWKIWCEKGN